MHDETNININDDITSFIFEFHYPQFYYEARILPKDLYNYQ